MIPSASPTNLRLIRLLRNEFDAHPLWNQVDSALDVLRKIETDAQSDEQPALQRIDFLLRHVRAHRELGTLCAMFNDGLLAPVAATVSQVLGYLNQRAVGSGYRSYTDNALNHAETLLVQIGLWPRPYAKGGQAKMMTTLFQDLLSAQAEQISALKDKYSDAQADIDILLERVNQRKDEVEGTLETFMSQGQDVLKAVNDQKARVDDVVQKGLERVNALQGQNDQAFDSWKTEHQHEWDSFVEITQDAMDKATRLADDSLKRIQQEEKEYANISSHLAGSKLADEFANEAKSAQTLGLWLYGIGFAVLAAAAAPLVFLMIWPPVYQEASGQWQHFLIRVSLGVIGASAATVLIRLGSRFVTGATASRRMALELKTFGPFLANVKDKSTVDGARLELVDRAFGKSYVPTETADSNEDAVPVSAVAHLVELAKAMK